MQSDLGDCFSEIKKHLMRVLYWNAVSGVWIKIISEKRIR